MLRIDERIYEIKKTTISNDSCSVVLNKKRIRAKAPYITFDLEENKAIIIETIYPINWLKDLKINSKIDFEKYISDLLYAEDKTLEELDYNVIYSTLEKIDYNCFMLKLNCDYVNQNKQKYNLEIEETIKIQYEV